MKQLELLIKVSTKVYSREAIAKYDIMVVGLNKKLYDVWVVDLALTGDKGLMWLNKEFSCSVQLKWVNQVISLVSQV